MRRRDKEIIEIGECASLASVIDRLQACGARLSPDAQAEVSIGGNDYFGWRLTISFFRELTAEELALEAKYSRTRRSVSPKPQGLTIALVAPSPRPNGVEEPISFPASSTE